nr:beta-ketoacyl-[acyl-carrier-protein] synthase III-like [Nerophis lumbriciformis]
MLTYPPIGLLGFGGYLPERVMTNDDWAKLVDTNDAWIVERTGIERRRIAAADQSTADLALEAARSVLEDCGLEATDLDEIILATDTPEVMVPDTASFLQHRLGAREIPAFDLAGSGCAGFVQALDVARARVLLGAERVLVVGVELISRWLTWKKRETDVLFGDAAGAAVVGRQDLVAEILAANAGTDGSQTEVLGYPAIGTRHQLTADDVANDRHKKVVMEGRQVFRQAVRRMTEASLAVLEQAGKQLDEVALVVPHQANLRILRATAERLGVPMEKLYVNVQEYGNTGSASVPVALWEARRIGRIQPGDLVLATAFGAGFHWAAVLLQF